MAPPTSSGKGGSGRRALAIGLVGTGLYAGLAATGAEAAEQASPEPTATATPGTQPAELQATPTPSPTSTPSPTPSPTSTPSPTRTPSPTPAPSPTPTPDPPAGESPPNQARGEVRRVPDRQPSLSVGDGRLEKRADRPARTERRPRPRRDKRDAAPGQAQQPNVSVGTGRLEQRGDRSRRRAKREQERRRLNISVRSGRLEERDAAGSPDAGVLGGLGGLGGPTIFSQSLLGGLPIAAGVPDVFVDSFRIPPVLLPIYQAAAMRYGVRWEVLAAINEIETEYGRNLNVSSAGARGWMQFMPASWKTYGVDANGDGVKDPYHPSDAIFAAGRYLRAAGAAEDLPRAIFAYNHADWYVESVLMRARVIAALPESALGSLSWLGRGRLPVPDGSRGMRLDREWQAVQIAAPRGARVVAVNDARIVRIGRGRLGRFLQLRDLAGNTYYYRRLQALPEASRLRRGKWVAAGTRLGSVRGSVDGRTGTIRFAVRPAGQDAPRIDPRPIIGGWRLRRSADLELTGKDGLRAAKRVASLGRILAMSKEKLVARVLADPRIDIYGCGRTDIRAGAIDRRVLATLAYLAAYDLAPTVSSLRCGHSLLTSSGNVSHHSTGSAVDIAAINGTPILGHQGPGSITELAVQRLAAFEGRMRPDQIITLMQFAGAGNTLAMADHADHIHVGWRPVRGSRGGASGAATLDDGQWIDLFRRLGKLDTSSGSHQEQRWRERTR